VSRAARFAACVLAASLAGCGYQTGSLMPEGARSIALSVAANETFYRQDEFAYTRRLGAELVRRAKVRLCDARDADAVLEATLVGMSRLPLVEGERDVVLEEGLIGHVEVTLRNPRTGRVIDRFVVKRRAEAVFPRGENLDTARAELAAELAEDTVVQLERRSFLLERGYGGAETRPVTILEEPR
jgi:hypothetical protein